MQSSNFENNKRIAKNTLVLYARMLLLMFVSLYTSRLNLQSLGVDDYGIYNVVGGLVAMFSIISGSLVASISRYLTFELGTGNKEKLKKVFSTSVCIQILLVAIVVVVAETAGLWFLNYKMVIPSDRMVAANVIYQFSLFSFSLALLSVPFTSAVVAHEKMSAFAYISILDAVGKLIVAFSTFYTPFDKLIWFAGIIVVNSIIIQSVYYIYCKRNFDECTLSLTFDKSLLKNMFGFAGWNFIGSIAAILRDQGGNVVINLFCGPAVNAARGVAMQVNGAVCGFVSNFQTALNPQITKNYASGEHEYMMKLIFQGARLSFYILLVLAMPILCNTHYIINLWLGQVPTHTVRFVQLALLFSMSESLANPLITAMLATGNIRNFQIIVGGLNLLNLPLSYAALKMGYPPESVMVVALFVSAICEFARVMLLRGMIRLKPSLFYKNVYFNVILVTLAAAVLPVWFNYKLEESFSSFVIICVVALFTTLLSIYCMGCNAAERQFVRSKAKIAIAKFRTKNDE